MRRTRVAKSGKDESIRETKEENSSDEGWVEVKGKTGQKRNHDKSLEKDNKPGIVLKEAPKEKPTVVVDWRNMQSKPMTLCQKKRQGIEFHPGTCQCSHHLLCEHQGETAGSGEGCHHPAHTCWTRVGPGGKADWCSWLGAHAIFDDCNEIIQECHGNGIMAFAICTKWTQHSNTPGAAGGNLAWLWKRQLGPLGAEELWNRLPKRFAMKQMRWKRQLGPPC